LWGGGKSCTKKYSGRKRGKTGRGEVKQNLMRPVRVRGSIREQKKKSHEETLKTQKG